MAIRDKMFWLTIKVRPWFNCPWTGTACVNKIGCIEKDVCWRFEQDKSSSLSELTKNKVAESV